MPEPRNLFDPAVRDDPYPFYAALRATSPACVVDPLGAWLANGTSSHRPLRRDIHYSPR